MTHPRLFLLSFVTLFVAAAAMPLAAGCGGPGTGGIGGNADSLTVVFHHVYLGAKPAGDAADEAVDLPTGQAGLTELVDVDGDGEADVIRAGTFIFVVNKNDGEQTDGGWLQGATLPNPSPLPSAAKSPEPATTAVATTQPSSP